jgi:hypothetical protein
LFSLQLFVVLYYLIKFAQLILLVFLKLFHYQSLGIYAVVHLLFELLNWSLHPMLIVEGRVSLIMRQLQLYLTPYLSHLEVWVHLNNLHLLLLVGIQVILVKSYSVKNAENDQSYVILFNLFFNSINQISLHSCFSEVLQKSLLFL